MSKKEGKGTPAWRIRKEHFEAYFDKLCEDMEQRGYQMHDLTGGVIKEIVVIIIIIFLFAAAYFPLYVFTDSLYDPYAAFYENRPVVSLVIFVILIFLLAALHEGICGFVWGLFARRRWKAISFGIMWKTITPYCICSEPLKKWQYIMGKAMPALILCLGFIIAIAVTGSEAVFFLFMITMIVTGIGDLRNIWQALAYRSDGKETVYLDHPYEPGIVVFERN